MKDTEYVSDPGKFINIMIDNPKIHEHQMQLRGTWWDKGFIDLDEQKTYAESEVDQDPYAYFTYHRNKK